MKRDIKNEIIMLKSYLKQDNVAPLYLVWIWIKRKISFLTSFTFSKWLNKHYFVLYPNIGFFSIALHLAIARFCTLVHDFSHILLPILLSLLRAIAKVIKNFSLSSLRLIKINNYRKSWKSDIFRTSHYFFWILGHQ